MTVKCQLCEFPMSATMTGEKIELSYLLFFYYFAPAPRCTPHNQRQFFFQGCFSLSVHYWAGVVELSRTTDNFKLSRRELTRRDAKQRWRRATPASTQRRSSRQFPVWPLSLIILPLFEPWTGEFFCCTTIKVIEYYSSRVYFISDFDSDTAVPLKNLKPDQLLKVFYCVITVILDSSSRHIRKSKIAASWKRKMCWLLLRLLAVPPHFH